MWSGRRDSNSRHLPWQGSALPAELLPRDAARRQRCVYKKNPRADRLFRDPAVRVSLARLRFTTQFGMEWGGSAVLWARGCLGLSWALPGEKGGESDARRGVKERGTSCATPRGGLRMMAGDGQDLD